MSVGRSIDRIIWWLATGAALLALVVASPLKASGQGGTVATIELVPLATAGPADSTTELPSPLVQVDIGASFVVEVWARTSDPQGLSSVSTTIQFDPTVAIVSAVTHTTLFSELSSGNVDNAAGFVVGLSGSHLSTCVDQVGVEPTWARVALLDIQVVGAGSLVVESTDTGLPALGTAICGVGDLSPSEVSYGSTTLSVAASPIPTVSQWGMVILVLMLLLAGTVGITRRAPSSSR